MKLLRFGDRGAERAGVLDAQGEIRDLSGIIDDVGGMHLAPASLAKLAALDLETLPRVDGRVRIGAAIGSPSKFVAIGLNYRDHAREANLPIPSEPVVFMKATTCISGPNDDVIRPMHSTKMDWEAEIGIVIGTKAQYVSIDEAPKHIAGYCVVNDVSERHYQIERGGTWDKGKGFDTFGTIGPYLVTADEVGDPQQLVVWLDVNGERMQTGTTADMIFSCAQIVSYVSECMTLLPGDVITTGTPAGVGLGMKPPRFLAIGDVMTVGIDKLGEQCQTVVDFRINP